MLLQFAGCQFADPRLFVEKPSVWFNTPITIHELNDHDRFLETQFIYKGTPLVVAAPLQPFFHPDTAYGAFLNEDAVHIYLFPNHQLLFDVALDNFGHFKRAFEALPGKRQPVYLFNQWAVKGVEGAIANGVPFEKRLRIHISRVTNLGKRQNEDQKGNFLALLDDLLGNTDNDQA